MTLIIIWSTFGKPRNYKNEERKKIKKKKKKMFFCCGEFPKYATILCRHFRIKPPLIISDKYVYLSSKVSSQTTHTHTHYLNSAKNTLTPIHTNTHPQRGISLIILLLSLSSTSFRTIPRLKIITICLSKSNIKEIPTRIK